jgi:hypothetical protein
MIMPPVPFEYLAEVRHASRLAFADDGFEILESATRPKYWFNEPACSVPSMVGRNLRREGRERRLRLMYPSV